MEEALTEYYKADEHCRALCERPLSDQFGYADQALKNSLLLAHWTAVLECKDNCPISLSTVDGEWKQDYLEEHYNYLQFTYFKLGNHEKAASCCETFLLLNPKHEVMLHNKEIYLQQPDVSLSHFTPRQEAVEYRTRQTKQQLLLLNVQQSLSEKQGGDRTAKTVQSGHVSVVKFSSNHSQFLVSVSEYLTENNLTLRTEEEEDGLGESRVVVDGILDSNACMSLVGLQEMAVMEQALEPSHGLTLGDAAILLAEGRATVEMVEAYLHAVEVSRAFVEKYYQLRSPLLFQFTDLSCVAPHSLMNMDEAPNGHMLANGTEDFVAVLYLSDKLVGGELLFTLHKKIAVVPGRLMVFKKIEMYRLLSVSSGRQCLLTMIFTLNPATQSAHYSQAFVSVRQATASTRESRSVELETFLSQTGYEVIQTELELNGPERFAAYNLATEQQCLQLIQLAQMAAVTGDGYETAKERSSPHTDHEKFVGLTMRRAAEVFPLP